MANGNGFSRITAMTGSSGSRQPDNAYVTGQLHPAWSAFIRYCQEICHGEIECLKIQDGVPVLAEVTKKKVKFA